MTTREFTMTITDIDDEVGGQNPDQIADMLEYALNRMAEHGRVEVSIDEVAS